MRIALAQLNPTSGDINGNAAKILDGARVERAPRARTSSSRRRWRCPATASAIWSRTKAFSPPTNARCAGLPTPRAASRRWSGSSISIRGAKRERRDPEIQRRRGRSRRSGPAARAQDAASELPLFRRQAVLRAGRRPRTGQRTGQRRTGSTRRVDLRRSLGRVLPHQAARRARRQGRRRSPEPERVTVLSRQAARARRDHPAAPCRPAQAARLHQHDRRGRQRQEHHPVRRREPRLRLRPDA